MTGLDKSWMTIKDRLDPRYERGVDEFLDFAFHEDRRSFRHGDDGQLIQCPCKYCRNGLKFSRREVKTHLICDGIWVQYINWVSHGDESFSNRQDVDISVDIHDQENQMCVDTTVQMLHELQDAHTAIGRVEDEPNANAKEFYKLLDDAETPLYPGCQNISRITFLLKLLHIKTMNQVTSSCMGMFLDLIREILPEGAYVPQSWYEAKKAVRDLGLSHEKIDACENDCVLFWKENEDKDHCPQCQTSRYKESANNENQYSARKRVPKKILRYFPLKDRLQRMFMSSMIAKWMTWHKDGRTLQEDGEMRHPADSQAWIHFDNLYPDFAAEARNVRLGLASDGFNPFANMSSRYSTWPVVMVIYNLPPWMCMKQPYTMMCLLIPGPKEPGNDIDVYLQPLIDELKDLWYNGVLTYDAAKKQNFNMRATLLWTLNDFPAYANLSGWSTRGTYACPTCNYNTHSKRLKNCKKFCYLGHRRFLPIHHRWRRNTYKDKFDGKVEFGKAPKNLNGRELWEQMQRLGPTRFGKTFKKDIEKLKGWKKQSIFFRELPYWQNLLIRHNLDVMHIEKNVCDNLLGTLNLLGPGYSKDNVKARLDLEDWGIRPQLHVPKDYGGKPPAAVYTLNKSQRLQICDFLRNIRVPDGYSSNLSKCVDFVSGKLIGLKSHDSHVYMQLFLPLALRGIVHADVTDPITELSMYFKDICSKVLRHDHLLKLEADIAVTLCKLEQIFPPSFFTSMIHLTVHLAYEARIAGPIQYRWMYPIERYLKKLKDYVLNKARLEGSIVEGYLLEETISFCSMYLPNIVTRFNRTERNYDGAPSCSNDVESLSIFNPTGRFLKGKAMSRVLSEEEVHLAHMYILKQIKEVDPFFAEHKRRLEACRGVEKDFRKWFRSYVQELKYANDPLYTKDIEVLSQTPSRFAFSHSGYIVNGFRFRTQAVDDTKQTQLCGVVVIANLNNKCDGYYGHLKDVVEISFDHNKRVVLFECDWWDVYHEGRGFQVDKYGIISLNTGHKLGTNEPFALSQQVEQVFYVDDNKRRGWIIPIRVHPRDYYNMDDERSETEIVEAFQQNLVDIPITGEIFDVDVTEGINLRVGEYMES